jgi:WD40 repeat protein
LEKKYEIPFNNNNNNNDNSNNDDSKNEILCYELYQQNIIICGHRSGYLSLWKPGKETYLESINLAQVTQSAINKMILTKLNDNIDYIFLCCSDGTVKKYSPSENKVVHQSQNFGNEIMDIKMVNDFNKQNIFVISLKNGLIKVLDMQLNLLFDIPSRFKISTTRKVLALKNPLSEQDNTKGDLLLITEGSLIDKYTWIKPGSFKHHNKNPQNFMPHGPYNNQMNGPHFGANFGPHFGPYFPPNFKKFI